MRCDLLCSDIRLGLVLWVAEIENLDLKRKEIYMLVYAFRKNVLSNNVNSFMSINFLI